MYFSNLIGRPTYEKEHLNLGKTGDSHKTNPSQLRRVSRPAPTARENTWQTNETNHAYVGVKRAAGNRLAYEKRAARLQKTSHLCKTNPPAFAAPIRRPATNQALCPQNTRSQNQTSRITLLRLSAIVRPGLRLTLCWPLPARFSFRQARFLCEVSVRLLGIVFMLEHI